MNKCLEELLKSIDVSVKFAQEKLMDRGVGERLRDNYAAGETFKPGKISFDKQFIDDFGKYIREAGIAAKEKAKAFHKSRKGELTDKDYTDLGEMVANEFRGSMLQFRKSDDLVRFTRRQLQENPELQPGGIKDDVGFLKSALTQVATRVHDKAAGQTRWASHKLGEIFSEANMTKAEKIDIKEAEAAVELFNNAIRNGDQIYDLIKQYDPKLTARDDQIRFLIKALEDRNIDKSTNIPARLQYIINGLKKFDDEIHAQANKESPHFKYDSQHTLPMRGNADKIRFDKAGWTKMVREEADVNILLGEKNLVDPGTRGKDVTNKEILKRIERTADDKWKAAINDGQFYIKAEYTPSSKAFDERTIRIVDQDNRIDYMMKYVDMESGVIGGFIKHRNTMLKKTALMNILGPDASRALHDIKSYLINERKISDTAATKAFDKIIPLFEEMAGKRSSLTITERNIVRGTSNLFSGLAGFSAIRNFTYDTTMHSGLVRAMITNEAGLPAVWNSYKGFFTHFFNTGKMNELKSIMESQGLTIEMAQNVMNQGLRESMDTMTLSDGSTTLGARVARNYNRATEWLGSKSGQWSGADRTNRAARTYQSTHIGNMFLKARNKSFDQIDKRLQKRMRRMDIGPKEWEVIRKLDVLKAPTSKQDVMFKVEYTKNELEALAKKLEDELGGPGAFDPEGGAARLFESTKMSDEPVAALQRIVSSYKLLHEDMLNQIVSLTSLKGGVLESEASGLLHALLNTAIGKFSNIAFSQWYDMHRAVYDAMDLNPNIVSSMNFRQYKNMPFAKRYAARMMGLATAQTAGGLVYLWGTDIIKGDTFRDPSMDAVYRALSMNGFAGVFGWATENFLYGDSRDVSTPAAAFIGPVKKTGVGFVEGLSTGDFEKMGEGAFDATQRIVSPLNQWYARAAMQRLFKEALFDRSKWERRKMKEEGREDWLRKSLVGER